MDNRPAPSSILTSASKGVRRLMESSFTGQVNIGSEEMVTINRLAEMAMEIAKKNFDQAYPRTAGSPRQQLG